MVTECRRTQPDLIITDLKMPHRDGLSAVLELWGERSIPVILISAYPQELAERVPTCSPWMTVLTKPVKKADLEPAILQAAKLCSGNASGSLGASTP